MPSQNLDPGSWPARGIEGVEVEALYEKLTGIFREVFDDDEIELRPDLAARDVDGWDSLRHVRLILTIEKAFGVTFGAAEVGRLQNVGDLVNLIQARA